MEKKNLKIFKKIVYIELYRNTFETRKKLKKVYKN
jgi:hypothetical protein